MIDYVISQLIKHFIIDNFITLLYYSLVIYFTFLFLFNIDNKSLYS